MRTMKLGASDLSVPVISVGCMRLNGLDKAAAGTFLRTAIDLGANFFDHADIYGGGACETLFAEALPMSDDLREKMILQSKCGIVRGRMFNFSKEYILKSVDHSLRRLKTDYLDVLLLHRPDALVEPEEVAEAFDLLKQSGRVRHFGVSNQHPLQIQLLQKYLKQPLVANQLQMSIAHAGMITAGINVNINNEDAMSRDGYVLDFCRLNDITVQAWSPFQHGFFGGTFLDNEKFPVLNAKISEIAAAYSVTNTTIALAWLLRHPAHIQPVTGTMNMSRLRDCVKASEITLTREEWYAIYLAAGNKLP